MNEQQMNELMEAIAGQMKPMMADMVAGLMNAIQELNIEVAAMAKRLDKAETANAAGKTAAGNGWASGTKIAPAGPPFAAFNRAWDRALEKQYLAQEAAKPKTAISPEQERAAVKLFGQEFVDMIYRGIEPQPTGQKQRWDNGEPIVEFVDHFFRPPKGADGKRQAYQAEKAAAESAAAAEQKRVLAGRKTWSIGHS